MNHILELAKQLGEELANSQELLAYREAEAIYLSDPAAQDLVDACQKERVEISQRGRQQEMTPETLETIRQELRANMEKVMENPTAKQYLEAQSGFHTLVNQVNSIIAHCIQGEDSGCGCDCSSCSGCH